jgi:hypothetical protein
MEYRKRVKHKTSTLVRHKKCQWAGGEDSLIDVRGNWHAAAKELRASFKDQGVARLAPKRVSFTAREGGGGG